MLKGLVRRGRRLPAKNRCTSALATSPVMKTTREAASGSSRGRVSNSSRPSISGILTSSRIKSYLRWRSRSSADATLADVSTS